MNRFHAHIYFEKKNQDRVRQLIELTRISGIFNYQELYDEPIGPHPFGMIELHFTEQVYIAALLWLRNNHNSFSILIHKDTGDDYRDHTVDIIWIGEPLKINFEFFELIKKYPELSVHK